MFQPVPVEGVGRLNVIGSWWGVDEPEEGMPPDLTALGILFVDLLPAQAHRGGCAPGPGPRRSCFALGTQLSPSVIASPTGRSHPTRRRQMNDPPEFAYITPASIDDPTASSSRSSTFRTGRIPIRTREGERPDGWVVTVTTR